MKTSASRVTYLDSSAIVKLVVREPESAALRRYIRRRRLVSSALARAEVARAVAPLGETASRRARDVLSRIDLVRINDRVLTLAGAMEPVSLRTLDAVHVATASLFGATWPASSAMTSECPVPPRRAAGGSPLRRECSGLSRCGAGRFGLW